MLGLRSEMGGAGTGFTGYILLTDHTETNCETLKARGVTLTKEPATFAWGTCAQFSDPDGNEFGILTPA